MRYELIPKKNIENALLTLQRCIVKEQDEEVKSELIKAFTVLQKNRYSCNIKPGDE